jgi:3-oxosteroid 1-dehydrogenase
MADWDHVTDFLVVGSGGGLAGAVAATVAGLDVLVIEKSEYVGGSTGMSGGVMWLPNNPLMQREGVPDSLDEALQYFSDVVGDAGPASSDARRRAYITDGVEMVRMLEHEGMRFVRCEGYSDYYAGVRGVAGGSVRGRAIECVPTDMRRIGPLAKRLRPSIAAPMVLRTGEAKRFSLIPSPRALAFAARIAARTAWGRLRKQRLTTNGAALITQLVEVLQRHGVPIWTETAFVDLITADGRIVGATVRRKGRDLRIAARRGMLVSAGGFSHNGPMRQRNGQSPNDGSWTIANPGDTGEVLETVIGHGAAADLLDESWWIPTILGPADKRDAIIAECSRPGSIIVDASGQRYFNEAVSYMEAGRQMYKRERETGGGVPSWLVLDARHRSHYLLGTIPPGWTPKKWLDGGYLKRSDTLAGLAQQCGMDPTTLNATVERFNRFAAAGVDEDFHRGEGAHERYQGDPRHRPNPCLGPLAKPPFYAINVYPGDVGTSGGLLCNEHSQVLSVNGDVMLGLYAAGNVTATVMGRTYPGAGASIASSAVFSFVAARHAASRPATAASSAVELPDAPSIAD